MTELPAAVLMQLGPSPMELTRLGASRIFRGNDLVAKFGPGERIAREAFLFAEASALMPVGVPAFVDAGPGWLLMQDPGAELASPNDVSPLAWLAPMHELFQGAAGIEHERFRDVFGRERDGLLAAARASSIADALPEPLASLLADPSPLRSIVDAEPRTLVHGDAGPGNVVARGPEGFVWLNWRTQAPVRRRSTSPSGSTVRRERLARSVLRARLGPTWRRGRRRSSPAASSAPWTLWPC